MPNHELTGALIDALTNSGVLRFKSATVPVSSAQILALHTTPVELVPASTGATIVPLLMLTLYHPGATPYAGTTNLYSLTTPAWGPGGSWDDRALSGPLPADNSATLYHGPGNNVRSFPAASMVGGALVLASGGAVTDGDGTLDVTVVYAEI